MKKIIMALALVLLFSVTDVAGKPRSAYGKANPVAVSKIDSAMKGENDAVEETAVAEPQDIADVDTLSEEASQAYNYVDDDGSDDVFRALESSGKSVGKVVAFCVFFLFAIGFPALVVIVIGVLIYKNRKNRYQMMMKAMETGHPLPDQLLPTAMQKDELLWRKGMKKLFVGGGLAIVSIVWDSTTFLTGTGILILFYGLGQMAIAYTSVNDPLGRRRKDDISDVDE